MQKNIKKFRSVQSGRFLQQVQLVVEFIHICNSKIKDLN